VLPSHRPHRLRHFPDSLLTTECGVRKQEGQAALRPVQPSGPVFPPGVEDEDGPVDGAEDDAVARDGQGEDLLARRQALDRPLAPPRVPVTRQRQTSGDEPWRDMTPGWRRPRAMDWLPPVGPQGDGNSPQMHEAVPPPRDHGLQLVAVLHAPHGLLVRPQARRHLVRPRQVHAAHQAHIRATALRFNISLVSGRSATAVWVKSPCRPQGHAVSYQPGRNGRLEKETYVLTALSSPPAYPRVSS
jgi:hypothetical protein